MGRTRIKLLLTLAIGLATFNLTNAHPWKAGHYVIVDTDGGLDDFRALNLMLASPEIRVLAIISSAGVLEEQQTYAKVQSLLAELHHEGIITAQFATPEIKPENCKGAIEFEWGSETAISTNVPNAVSGIKDLISQFNTSKITFVSLGSLASASTLLDSIPEFATKLDRLVWVAGSSPASSNFNYQLSPESFNTITKQHKKPFVWIDGQAGYTQYASDSFDSLLAIVSIYAQQIARSLRTPTPFANRMFDEQSVLYLLDSTLFSGSSASGIRKIEIKDVSSATAYVHWALEGGKADRTQVLTHFPDQKDNYQDDVASIFDRAYYAYGSLEWNAGVLANELHRHLGLYAIIGVKMGIRARDYFGAGLDEITLVSEAGLVPPYSCLNDGLQVSTGATLGHGLISVDELNQRLPAARFTYMGKTIRLSLKPEYRKEANEMLSGLRSVHGLSSDIYWDLVREEALRYWLKWNRNEIFEIEVY